MKAALIGQGIAGSLTPAMHEAEGAAQGFGYSYASFDTNLPPYRDMTLPELLQLAEAEGRAGLNITHPFKAAVIEFLDEIAPSARAVGAVNTVLLRDGRRIGHNTDYPGFRNALEGFEPAARRQHVLLMGAGGAGGPVGMALLDAGVARLDIVEPVAERGVALADRLKGFHEQVRIEPHTSVEGIDLAALDGVVNATPLGMTGHPGMAIDPALLPASTWVADIVYFPRETALLRAARARGMATLDGTAMALHQAAEAFGLITGRTPDRQRMAACLHRLLAQPETGGKNP